MSKNQIRCDKKKLRASKRKRKVKKHADGTDLVQNLQDVLKPVPKRPLLGKQIDLKKSKRTPPERKSKNAFCNFLSLCCKYARRTEWVKIKLQSFESRSKISRIGKPLTQAITPVYNYFKRMNLQGRLGSEILDGLVDEMKCKFSFEMKIEDVVLFKKLYEKAVKWANEKKKVNVKLPNNEKRKLLMNENQRLFKKNLEKLTATHCIQKWSFIGLNSFKTTTKPKGRCARFSRYINHGYPQEFTALANSPGFTTAFQMAMGSDNRKEEVKLTEYFDLCQKDHRCTKILQAINSQLDGCKLKNIPPLGKLRKEKGIQLLYLPRQYDKNKALSRQRAHVLDECVKGIRRIRAVEVGKHDFNIFEEMRVLADVFHSYSQVSSIGSSKQENIRKKNTFMERARQSVLSLRNELEDSKEKL